MGGGLACQKSVRPGRQRGLFLCDISSARVTLTALTNVYIDFSSPKPSCFEGSRRVVRGIAVPYKAGLSFARRAVQAGQTPRRRGSNAVEESRRGPVGLGTERTMGPGSAI